MSDWQKINAAKKETLPPIGRWVMGTQAGWPGPFTLIIKDHQWYERKKIWLFSARTIDGEPIHITYWREIQDIDKP